MEEIKSYPVKVYLPDKNYDYGLSKAYQYRRIRDILKPSVSATIFPKTSPVIVVNIPGYNSDMYGYDSLYLNMSHILLKRQNASVILADNKHLRGYDNQKILLEKGRAILDYVIDHAEEISGSPNPSIYLIGTSAGGSCAAALAWEYPLVRRILLINPSGDIPESTMRNSLSRFSGRVIIANGRCDFYIGPQSGYYLGAMASNAQSIRYLSLPDTEHSFRNAYSRRLVSVLPNLLFANKKFRFPPITPALFYHSVVQLPKVIAYNLNDSINSAVSNSAGSIAAIFIRVIKTFSTFRSIRAYSPLLEFSSWHRFYTFLVHLSNSYDFPSSIKAYSSDHSETVVYCLLNNINQCKNTFEKNKLLQISSRYIGQIFTEFSQVRTRSFISQVFTYATFSYEMPADMLKDSSNNHFFNLCKTIDKSSTPESEESVRRVSSLLEVLDPSILTDQRFWKILYSIFVHTRPTNTVDALITLILHQPKSHLLNDYFWLIAEFIINSEKKPRHILSVFLDVSRYSKTEISRAVLSAMHLAKDDMDNLMVLFHRLPKETFSRIIEEEQFLEHLLIISKIKGKSIRNFHYSMLMHFLSQIPSGIELNGYITNLQNIFAGIQSRMKHHSDECMYKILLSYAVHSPAQKLNSIAFWDKLIPAVSNFYDTIKEYHEELADVLEYLSFLPADTDNCTSFYQYFSAYYRLFGSDAKDCIVQLKPLHPHLFYHIHEAQFDVLLETVKKLAYSQFLGDKPFLDVFFSYPDIMLRVLSQKIYRCTYADINASLRKINTGMIPLTQFNIKSVLMLLSLSISFENKYKLLSFILLAADSFEMPDDAFRESFSHIPILEGIHLLQMKYPEAHTISKNQSRVFRILLESLIVKETSPEYDAYFSQLLKSYSLNYSDSFIIGKFLRRSKIDSEQKKEKSQFAFNLLYEIVNLYLAKKTMGIIDYVGLEHSKEIEVYLKVTDRQLHTVSGKPYYLPESAANTFYGLWRLVDSRALQNYLLYGHEVKKSESKYTYLGLHREECFSLPDLSGFMVWIPTETYNRSVEEQKVHMALREKSTNEVVLNNDLQKSDLKVYFLCKELFESHKDFFHGFAVIELRRLSSLYRKSLNAPAVKSSRRKEYSALKNVIATHQTTIGKQLAVIYSGKDSIKDLKNIFKRNLLKLTFPQLSISEIRRESLVYHLHRYFEKHLYNELSIYFKNAYRRGVPVIKKTFRRGFNEGYLVYIKRKRFYGKSYENPDRMRAELLSWCIYREAGSLVKKDVRILSVDGKLMILGEWISAPTYKHQNVAMESLALDFILSCFIQDRDQGKPDNYLYVAKNILPFDFGGSFMFRSTGGKKGDDGQLPFCLDNFKDMLRTDSVHFRKEMYSVLRSHPRVLEQAMFRLIRTITPAVIEQFVTSIDFKNSEINTSIASVLNKSRNYLVNRLAFLSYRQRQIDAVPVRLDAVFDILNSDSDPHFLMQELDRRLSTAESLKHLLPNFTDLHSVVGTEHYRGPFPGYQTRVLGVGRFLRIVETQSSIVELSSGEISTIAGRLGALSYEITILLFLLQNQLFIQDILAVCGRSDTSYFDKAEQLQKYISDVFANAVLPDGIILEMYIHDLLSVCLYMIQSGNNQAGTYPHKILERYRYNLSENLFFNNIDI